MIYSEYLKGEHWKLMRRLRMEYDDDKCAVCGSVQHLNVHHKTYDRIGCEKLKDLVTLCKSCHAKYHDKLESGDFEVKKPQITENIPKKENDFIDYFVGQCTVKVNCNIIEGGKLSVDGKPITEMRGNTSIELRNIPTGLCEFKFEYGVKTSTIVEVIKLDGDNTINFCYDKKDFEAYASEVNKNINVREMTQENINNFKKLMEIRGINPYLEKNGALINAVSSENMIAAKYLIEKEYNINSQDNYGRTALNLACEYGRNDFIDLLIKNNAEVTEKTIYAAAEKLTEEQIEFFLKKCSVVIFDTLYRLVRRKMFKFLGKLKEYGIDLNMENPDGRTIAYNIATEGQISDIEYAISIGIDFKRVDRYNNTIISILFSQQKSEDKIIYLFDNVYREDSLDVNKRSYLFNAVAWRMEKLSKKLLDLGYDINCVDGNKTSILMSAVENGMYEIVNILLNKGVNINILNTQGENAIFKTIPSDKQEIAKLLISKGVNLDIINNNKMTPLIMAIYYSKQELAILFIDSGADINVTYSDKKETPLQMAKARNLTKVVERLSQIN